MYKSFWQFTASGRIIIFLLKGKKFQENGSSRNAAVLNAGI